MKCWIICSCIVAAKTTFIDIIRNYVRNDMFVIIFLRPQIFTDD
jgi:hypothetical protein